MGKKIILTKLRFGDWLVLGESSKRSAGKSKAAYWDCECLLCHKIYSVESKQLRNGESTKCKECRLNEARQGMKRERFGDWLVLKESETQARGNLFWDCRCLGCDRVYSVSGTRLRLGKTKSCVECSGNAKIDLTEQIISNWFVIKESERNHTNDTQAHWDCECLICHTIHSIPGGRLRRNKSHKCRQCYLNETRIDLRGQKFGAWLVESLLEKENKNPLDSHAFWHCRCLSCNNLYAVAGSQLRRGKTTICKKCFVEHARKNIYHEYNEDSDRFRNKNHRYFTNDEILEFPVKTL